MQVNTRYINSTRATSSNDIWQKLHVVIIDRFSVVLFSTFERTPCASHVFSALWVIYVHSPLNSWHGLHDLQCVYVICLHETHGTSLYSLFWGTFFRVCTRFDSGDFSGCVLQSLTCNGHPFMWWQRLIMLNLAFGIECSWSTPPLLMWPNLTWNPDVNFTPSLISVGSVVQQSSAKSWHQHGQTAKETEIPLYL